MLTSRTEHYKGFVIRAFERETGCWQAEIYKADGADLTILVLTGKHPLITTSGDGISADAAIKRAKRVIDVGGVT